MKTYIKNSTKFKLLNNPSEKFSILFVFIIQKSMAVIMKNRFDTAFYDCAMY